MKKVDRDSIVERSEYMDKIQGIMIRKHKVLLKNYLRGLKYVLWLGVKRYNKTARDLTGLYYHDNTFPDKHQIKTVVSMVDGLVLHGGLTDRLRGIVYVYHWCKVHRVRYKICFTTPFRLEEFLVPNKTDWRLTDGELVKNPTVSRPLFVDVQDCHPWEPILRNWYFRLKMLLYTHKYCQTHVYTNLMGVEKKEYSALFNELFKPSAFLQQKIDRCKAEICLAGGGYLSVSFRFLELLGDFKDNGMRKPLPPKERDDLIAACIAQIDKIREHVPMHEKVVITADSAMFIERVRRLPYVYTIPGAIGHIEHGANRMDIHLKTFLDYFIIAGARKAYLVRNCQMYSSGFARYAAMINNIPFEEVVF